jgi:hypothetical protein
VLLVKHHSTYALTDMNWLIQSNIEGIEHVFLMAVTQCDVRRLQGGIAPVSRRSSEEKQTTAVAVTPQQPISLEAPSHMITRTGLTESSSSSKYYVHLIIPILSFYLFLNQNISNRYFLNWFYMTPSIATKFQYINCL